MVPIGPTVIKTLHEPLAGQLGVAQLMQAGGSCCPGCLGCFFQLFSLFQPLSELTNAFVQQQLLLDFLQNFPDFEIRFKRLKGFQQLFMTRVHVEMTHPEARSVL